MLLTHFAPNTLLHFKQYTLEVAAVSYVFPSTDCVGPSIVELTLLTTNFIKLEIKI